MDVRRADLKISLASKRESCSSMVPYGYSGALLGIFLFVNQQSNIFPVTFLTPHGILGAIRRGGKCK